MKKNIKSFEEAAEFHGHVCPGLAIGYRAAEVALDELFSKRSDDEEIVCIVENDACSIDGIQVVAGCTIGKGNLLFRDHGKQVYTFILRDGSDAVRVSQKPEFAMNSAPGASELMKKFFSGEATAEEEELYHKQRSDMIDKYLTSPADEVFEIRHVKPEIPEKARLFNSVRCAECGETVSESRARVKEGKFVCIPCSNEYGGINR
ncbi:MAG: TraR/DksA C4-type zinc finger protein [Methanomicrobiaceae archaeon]|nr:TraR/DksA C4-type zinc finger protein [Methanomicrobiaceae archaeon]